MVRWVVRLMPHGGPNQLCLVPTSAPRQVVGVKYFNVHIQNKLLYHTPVMGTHSSYQLGCMFRTDG